MFFFVFLISTIVLRYGKDVFKCLLNKYLQYRIIRKVYLYAPMFSIVISTLQYLVFDIEHYYYQRTVICDTLNILAFLENVKKS